MSSSTNQPPGARPAPIFVVSGGSGASGEQVVWTALAQFPEADVPVIMVPHVRQAEEVEDVVERAAGSTGTIVHTFVDPKMRQIMIRLARERHVPAIDLMGPLLTRLSASLGQRPLGQPGRYAMLHADYFQRVEAIEFTVAHDDGCNPEEWPLAEIVLAGVSRVGKTPLSMYLSVQGWKVANVPLVYQLPTPPELLRLDPRRVVGLTIDPFQLLTFRRSRMRNVPLTGTAYLDPDAIAEELKAALLVFRRSGFAVIDITDKPIEVSADEVIALISRRVDRSEEPVARQLPHGAQ
jgi:regulator of PEP synthase PpsR (kinase-PPPase family)